MDRPTLKTVIGRLIPFIGRPQACPKTADKGGAGQHLERLVRIPRSSACLDCEDGEVKTFPLKAGKPKETCAITMIQPDTIVTTPFEHSNVHKKLANTLFVPYERTEDTIAFHHPILLTAADDLFAELAADYEAIQASYAVGEPSSAIGQHLQARTKGPGHGSTSRAFYLRTSFLKMLLERPPMDMSDVPVLLQRRR